MAAEWEVDRKGLDLGSQFRLNSRLSVIRALLYLLFKVLYGSRSGVSLRNCACKTQFLLGLYVGARGG